MSKKQNQGQFIWGVALVVMGISVFFRIPQVMPKIVSIEYFSSGFAKVFTGFSLYLMAIVLLGSGLIKIARHYMNTRKNNESRTLNGIDRLDDQRSEDEQSD